MRWYWYKIKVCVFFRIKVFAEKQIDKIENQMAKRMLFLIHHLSIEDQWDEIKKIKVRWPDFVNTHVYRKWVADNATKFYI